MFIKRILAVVFVWLAALDFVQAQQLLTADAAFTLASEKNRNVLLVFSGSDWCAQCIHFEKKVLSDPAFIQFADSDLILLAADFPQGKKQSPEIKKQNEELAERYNPSGRFPLILLLHPDRSILCELNYQNETAEEFITMINRNQQ